MGAPKERNRFFTKQTTQDRPRSTPSLEWCVVFLENSLVLQDSRSTRLRRLHLGQEVLRRALEAVKRHLVSSLPFFKTLERAIQARSGHWQLCEEEEEEEGK